MYNNNNYYQSQMQQAYRQVQGLKGRPVTSLDEVRAASIDFDGSVFFFPDLANNRIYTKQISMDGTASLKVFELAQMPVINQTGEKDYITREEFNNAISSLKGLITAPQEQVKTGGDNLKF